MVKKFKLVDQHGREISSDELVSILFIKPKQTEQTHLEPPKDSREFEDRIGAFLNQTMALFFGRTYDVETSKTLKRDKSVERLVEALCCYEKNLKGKVLHEHVDTYNFLKLVLERDAPLFEQDLYLLGIERDRTGLKLPQKNAIAVQCAAQVLWHLEGNRISTIEAMEVQLLNRSAPFFELLELERFLSERTIANWVSEVFPVPKGVRKGRPSIKQEINKISEDLITIPGIFPEEQNKVNFLKLRFALMCFTRILKIMGWTPEAILESRYIHHYVAPLRFYPVMYAKQWVQEAYSENSSIFDH